MLVGGASSISVGRQDSLYNKHWRSDDLVAACDSYCPAPQTVNALQIAFEVEVAGTSTYSVFVHWVTLRQTVFEVAVQLLFWYLPAPQTAHCEQTRLVVCVHGVDSYWEDEHVRQGRQARSAEPDPAPYVPAEQFVVQLELEK
jgi:hypothetical protein